MHENPDPRLGPIFDVAFGTQYGAPPPANGSTNGSAHSKPHFDPNFAYFHVQMAEKNKLLNQFFEEIHQKNEEISFKNQELTNKNGQIARKDEELAFKSQEIASKDAEISFKNQELIDKNGEIAKKDEELAIKSQEIAKKDEEISNKNQELLKQNEEIEKGNKTIIMITEDLDRYEMAGEVFFKSINGLKETPRKIQNWLKRKQSQVETEENYETFPSPTPKEETPEVIRNEKRKQSLKTTAELEKVRLMLTDISIEEDQGNDNGSTNGLDDYDLTQSDGSNNGSSGSTNGLVNYNLTQSDGSTNGSSGLTNGSSGSTNGSDEISPTESVIPNFVKIKKPEELLDDAIIFKCRNSPIYEKPDFPVVGPPMMLPQQSLPNGGSVYVSPTKPGGVIAPPPMGLLPPWNPAQWFQPDVFHPNTHRQQPVGCEADNDEVAENSEKTPEDNLDGDIKKVEDSEATLVGQPMGHLMGNQWEPMENSSAKECFYFKSPPRIVQPLGTPTSSGQRPQAIFTPGGVPMVPQPMGQPMGQSMGQPMRRSPAVPRPSPAPPGLPMLLPIGSHIDRPMVPSMTMGPTTSSQMVQPPMVSLMNSRMGPQMVPSMSMGPPICSQMGPSMVRPPVVSQTNSRMGPQMMPTMGQQMMYPQMGPAMTLPMGQGMMHPNGNPVFNAMGQPLTPLGHPISQQMLQQIRDRQMMMTQATQFMNMSVGQSMGQPMRQPMGQPMSDQQMMTQATPSKDPSMVQPMGQPVRNHGN